MHASIWDGNRAIKEPRARPKKTMPLEDLNKFIILGLALCKSKEILLEFSEKKKHIKNLNQIGKKP
jgi:hypothetical protein